MTDAQPEPKRPEPASVGFTGDDWSALTDAQFIEKEQDLKENLRRKSHDDYFAR
jgi:hypothetical protein